MKRFSYNGSLRGKTSVSLAIHALAIGLIAAMMLMGTAMGEISRNGLVAEWHFDEGAGNIAKDSSGNGNDGVIYGATFADGKFGKALSFNGVSDYVQIPVNSALDNTDFTMSSWFYQIGNGKGSGNTILDRLWDGNNQNTIEDVVSLYTWNQNLFLYYNWNGSPDHPSTEYFTSNTIISNNIWYFVSVTKNKRSFRIYINGQKTDEIALPNDVNPYLNSANWLIGAQIDAGSVVNQFNGIIDEVRLYNRALSDQEIKAIYEAGQIIVTSSPPGAEILINNQSKGTASPTLTVAGISPGSYAVRCKLSGYLDYDSNVVLTAGSVASINCALNPAPISTPTTTPTPTTPIPTTPAPTTTPTLTPTPTPTTPTTALITGNVMDAQTDKPVQDATITIDGNSTITGSDGEYQLVVSSGNHNITVNKSGYETRKMSVNVSGAGTVDLSIKQIPPSTPLWSILILIIILILAAIILYLWTRGNLQVIPKQTSVPCDGKSTLPIKVQFVNTFGKPRKQSKDREVEMEATSGKIQNVVIPTGKESAEATLTSSTEGGAVTITAKSGKQKATTQVNFVCEETRIEVDVSSAAIPADGSSTATVTIKSKDATGKYVTSLNERTVELTTTLGTITSPVTIPPKTLAGIAIVTSGQVSGTAIITASIGSLKGEGKIVFAEIPKKYCMHCGAPMAIQLKSCPVCGNVPPSGVDTKQCSTCGAILPMTAKFCDKCGARQPI